MRRAAKRDDNEREIIEALRCAGASVHPINDKGAPDLLVGYAGRNYLMEVKDGKKPPSKRQLTPDQVCWHEKWLGTVFIVNNVEEALNALNGETNTIPLTWTE